MGPGNGGINQLRSRWVDETVIRGEERQEQVPRGVREVEDLDAPSLAFPEPIKGLDLVLDVLKLSPPFPGEMGVEALPVADPAGTRLVVAAAEGEAIILSVGDDSDLFVIDASDSDQLAPLVGR